MLGLPGWAAAGAQAPSPLLPAQDRLTLAARRASTPVAQAASVVPNRMPAALPPAAQVTAFCSSLPRPLSIWASPTWRSWPKATTRPPPYEVALTIG